MKRWAAAGAVMAGAVAAVWAFCQAIVGMDTANSIAVSGLVLALIVGSAGARAVRASRPAQTPPPEAQHDQDARVHVTNLGPRNPSFVGRDAMLTTLQDQLDSGGPVVVQALYGLGGVGKTALAVEYAHRYGDAYDIVWWVDAERASLIGEQIGGLAVSAGWASPNADSLTAIGAVRQHLAQTTRWLLVLDNAPSPIDVMPWLSLGPGHVLVTSRHPGWDQVAHKVEVDVFTRQESINFLRRVVPRLSDKSADDIAYRTGDLPLALAQAAGVLAETGMPTESYLEELRRHANLVMSERPPSSYPVSLAAAIRVSALQLEEQDPAALHLLRLCAPMAPEPGPLDLLFPVPNGLIGDPLASAGSAFEVNTAAARLARLGLARLSGEGLELHRMTQAVLVDQLDPKSRERLVLEAERLLVAAAPDTSDDTSFWPTWSRLLPHILAMDPARSDHTDFRELASDAVRYLLNRGEADAGRLLAENLVENWHGRYGEADRIALNAAYHLARALRELGQHEDALDLSEGVLERYRELEGDDAPATLAAATGFAASLRALGRTQQALELDRDTLDRKRRILTRGEDDPSTLASASGLASDLRDLGRLSEAEVLDRETLDRKRRTLGEDHLSTLTSAANLATDLRLQHRLTEATVLQNDLFIRTRRVLGDAHPMTLSTARALARDLRARGEQLRAEDVERFIHEQDRMAGDARG